MIRYIVAFCIVELIFFLCGIVEGSGAHFEETDENEKAGAAFLWVDGCGAGMRGGRGFLLVPVKEFR